MELVKIYAVDTSGKPGFNTKNSQYKIIFYTIIVLAKTCPALSKRNKNKKIFKFQLRPECQVQNMAKDRRF